MPILLSKVNFDKSQYANDYGKRRKGTLKGIPARPTSSFRRNNPHPRSDFLLPKSLKDSEDNVIQVKVEQASRRYLDHLGYSQTDPPTKLLHNVLKASQRIHQGTPEQDVQYHDPGKPTVGANEFIQESLKLLESSRKGDRGQLKRERGNSYKDAARDYATTPSPPRSGKPTHSTAVGRSSKLINSSGDDLVQSMKRVHPTTPPGTATRPRSVNYEAQRVAQKKAARTPTKLDESEINERLISSTNGNLKETRPVTAVDFSAYSPRFKSWVAGANEYEKEVAYNLFNSLQFEKSSSRKGSMSPNSTGVYVAGGNIKRNNKEDQTIQRMMKLLGDDVDRQSAMPNPQPKFSSERPHYRKIRRAPSFDGYMHIGSQFRATQPPFRKSFDIAPDWCSEGKTYRRLMRKVAQNQSV